MMKSPSGRSSPVIFDPMADSIGDGALLDPTILGASTPNADMFTSQLQQPTFKRGTFSSGFADSHSSPSDTRSDSPGDSTGSGDSPSATAHVRNGSVTSNHSASFSHSGMTSFYTPNGWSGMEDYAFERDNMLMGENGFPGDADIESSNKLMDSSFDFDSAATSPSPFNAEVKPEKPQSSDDKAFNIPKNESGPSTSFFFKTPTESPKFTTNSPPSDLDQTFNAINMNATSPFNPTFSPNQGFGHQGFNVDTFGRYPPANFSDSPSTINSDVQPRLIVHRTSLKSRVETQIPIKLSLYPAIPGVKKLRLPRHAISKPKFFAKPETGPSPEILELSTSVVCTSAMQDKAKLDRALARARGETVARLPGSSGRDEESPAQGGEVKICSGCIQRERKRASRKKQRKPEEDELFQKDEDKRVIVFNTTELKDWQEPQPILDRPSDSPAPPGSVQVDLPMRIACYCRHQNEKLGFQVIFTLKDSMGNVLSQAMTNSIMITDDHKTHVPTSAPLSGSTVADKPKFPGAGVFPAASGASTSAPSGAPSFRASHSTTDLQALRDQSLFMRTGSTSSNQSHNAPPLSGPSRSLSRQTSPTEFQGPSSKRRKQNSASKIQANLTMTRMEPSTPASSSSTTNPTGSQFLQKSQFTNLADRPFATPAPFPPQFVNGPPTPNANDGMLFNPLERSQTADSFSPQIMSAPRSAQPSRPGSPSGTRASNDSSSVSVASTQAWGVSSPGQPPRLPPRIHKLVPAEGSVAGGSEVTLLGSGFYPGMEVVFGDTLATTTTFWGEKCLNCLTPPAVQPGIVTVVFKHEHLQYRQGQQNLPPAPPRPPVLFRYVDDSENQMFRLALDLLGQRQRNPKDAFRTAQQIISGGANMPDLQNNLQGGGHSYNGGNSNSRGSNVKDLDGTMLAYLEFVDLDDSPRPPRYNIRSPSGQTLLHFAAMLGLTRFVAGLLARGANPNVRDNNGNTPLHLAALRGHTHIIHRLRLTGAHAGARNLRDFAPADLASTLAAHQAVLIPQGHYRSRSVGSSPSVRRRASTVSLDNFWEPSSAEDFVDSPADLSDGDSDDESVDSDAADDVPGPALYYTTSRRASTSHDGNAALYYTRSREGSVQPSDVLVPGEAEPAWRAFSPPAALVAWRNQLTDQIHQFQQSVNRAFPNLPALPPMPTLPDYQAHPMMRRITSLVPNKPTAPWPSTIVRDGWDRLTGNSSPPPYEELYPVEEEENEGYSVKKSSMVQAAADAALDNHFESKESSSTRVIAESSMSVTKDAKDIGEVQIGRKHVSKEQQEKLRLAHARKMKRIRSDRNLFFIWIPLLVAVVLAMLNNFLPLGDGFSKGFEFVKSRFVERPAARTVENVRDLI